jgi:antibiotic biosynthesis monooxygenase (ABM) superfamily enzyme
MIRNIACASMLSLVCAVAAASDECRPAGYDREALDALKAQQFELSDGANRQAVAEALVACLADPDPSLRDGIAYEALSQWLRADQLHAATRRRLLAALTDAMSAVSADAAGFRQPFAALVMSELARTDRISAWLEPAERAALVETAASYVESVRDYRGFVTGEGWRHGVAHGADLLMQLAMNPALDKAQLDRILAAVASQVAPPGEHAWTDGESERLARPVLFVAQRGLHTGEEWKAWFVQLARPAPLPDWSHAFASREGLAKRHNLLTFLRAAYVGAREGGDAKFEVIVPGVVAAMKEIP